MTNVMLGSTPGHTRIWPCLNDSKPNFLPSADISSQKGADCKLNFQSAPFFQVIAGSLARISPKFPLSLPATHLGLHVGRDLAYFLYI